MKNGTYNEKVFMPKEVERLVPVSCKEIHYSSHAKRESYSDRYGRFNLPEKIDLSEVKVVEVTVKNNKAVKYVVRSAYSDRLDIVFVFTPVRGHLFCKTVWLNEAKDNHRTLNVHSFVKAS